MKSKSRKKIWWRQDVWAPEVGSVLTGEVCGRLFGFGGWGPNLIGVLQDPETGRIIRLDLSHANLREGFISENPQLGDLVEIERLEDLGPRFQFRVTVKEAAKPRFGRPLIPKTVDWHLH